MSAAHRMMTSMITKWKTGERERVVDTLLATGHDTDAAAMTSALCLVMFEVGLGDDVPELVAMLAIRASAADEHRGATCAKCGHPRAGHNYRHIFVAA